MTEKIHNTDQEREETASPPLTADRESGVSVAEAPASTPKKSGGIRSFLKMAACCGGALLLLPALGLVSMGGLAAVGGSLLSIAAVLACPVGMYFMMRGMMKAGDHAGHGSDASADQKGLPPKEPGPLA